MKTPIELYGPSLSPTENPYRVVLQVAAAAHWHPSAVELLFPPPAPRRRLLQARVPVLLVEARVHVTTVQQGERGQAGLALLALGGDEALTATMRDRILPELQLASIVTMEVRPPTVSRSLCLPPCLAHCITHGVSY